MNVKRLRVFAGPNGSGKSTITSIVREAGVSLGIYVNADEMKKIINATKTFDFSHYLKPLMNLISSKASRNRHFSLRPEVTICVMHVMWMVVLCISGVK